MGLFARLFGKRPKQSLRDPAVVQRDGHEVIEVADTFAIKGRGVVVTGQALAPLTVGEQLDVDHAGQIKSLPLSQITIDDEVVESAAPGARVAALLTTTNFGTWIPT